MLRRRYAWENRIHRPHGPHLCEHRPLSGNQRSSSPECTDPHVGDRRGGNPRHERGVLRARLLRPQGVTRMVVAHFFESGQRRRLRWAESRAHRYGRASSAGQHRVHSCDRRKGLGGATSLGPGVQVPQREPALPTEDSSRAEYARRKVESSFWSGGWIAAQLRPPGDRL